MDKRYVVPGVVALVLALAAATAVGLPSATRVKLSAASNGDFKFNKKILTAHRGTVTIVMTNPSSTGIDHGIAVQGKGVNKDGKTVAPGKQSVLTLKLKPGTYTFYCPVPGHRAAGMKGKLIVK